MDWVPISTIAKMIHYMPDDAMLATITMSKCCIQGSIFVISLMFMEKLEFRPKTAWPYPKAAWPYPMAAWPYPPKAA